MAENMPVYRATDNLVRYTHPEGWTARVEILGRFDMPGQGWLYEVRTVANGRVWCNVPERALSDWTQGCPNTWHATGYGATGARCPECPALQDIEEVAAVDVLQEALRGLGVPHVMVLETPVLGASCARDARVAIRLPSGQVFTIAVEESQESVRPGPGPVDITTGPGLDYTHDDDAEPQGHGRQPLRLPGLGPDVQGPQGGPGGAHGGHDDPARRPGQPPGPGVPQRPERPVSLLTHDP